LSFSLCIILLIFNLAFLPCSTIGVYVGTTAPVNGATTYAPAQKYSETASDYETVTVYTNDPFYNFVGTVGQTFYIRLTVPSNSPYSSTQYTLNITMCSNTAQPYFNLCPLPPPHNAIVPLTIASPIIAHVDVNDWRYYSLVATPPPGTQSIDFLVTPQGEGQAANLYVSRTAPQGDAWTDELSSILANASSALRIVAIYSNSIYFPSSGSQTYYVKVYGTRDCTYQIFARYIVPTPNPTPGGPQTMNPTYGSYGTYLGLPQGVWTNQFVNATKTRAYYLLPYYFTGYVWTAFNVSVDTIYGDPILRLTTCCTIFGYGSPSYVFNSSATDGFSMETASIYADTPYPPNTVTGTVYHYIYSFLAQVTGVEDTAYRIRWDIIPPPPAPSPPALTFETVYPGVAPIDATVMVGRYRYFRFTAFNAGSFIAAVIPRAWADCDCYLGVLQPTSTTSWSTYAAYSILGTGSVDSVVTSSTSSWYQGQNGVYYIGSYGFSAGTTPITPNYCDATVAVYYGTVIPSSTPVGTPTPSQAPFSPPQQVYAGVNYRGWLAPGAASYFKFVITRNSPVTVFALPEAPDSISIAVSSVAPVCNFGIYQNASACAFQWDEQAQDTNIGAPQCVGELPNGYHFPGVGGTLYIRVANQNQTRAVSYNNLVVSFGDPATLCPGDYDPTVTPGSGLTPFCYWGKCYPQTGVNCQNNPSNSACSTNFNQQSSSSSLSSSGVIAVAVVVPVVVVAILLVVAYFVVKKKYLNNNPNVSWGASDKPYDADMTYGAKNPVKKPVDEEETESKGRAAFKPKLAN
jgi:hypothetical protein